MPALPYRSHPVLHHPGDTLLGTQQSDPETRDGDPVEEPGVQQCDRRDHREESGVLEIIIISLDYPAVPVGL